MNYLEQIFSVKNKDYHKIIKFLGLKIKIKNKHLIEQTQRFEEQMLIKSLHNKVDSLKQIELSNIELNEKIDNLSTNLLPKKYLSLFQMKIYKKFYRDMLNMDIVNKYKKLIANLDDESSEIISKILSKIVFVGTNDQKSYCVYTSEEMSIIKKIQQEISFSIAKLSADCYAYKQYLLPINHFEASVFYYKHSVNKLRDLSRLKNKDIIDVGAFIGDSAIVLSEYTNNKIYSFEPTNNNYNLLLKTIELNNKQDKIVPIKSALGANIDEKLSIYVQDSGSSINRVIKENPPVEEIQSTTLDSFVDKNNLDIGLIKVDIEGFEQEFLKGAMQTIKTQKPTLLISIYHSASDFFNIKPMIEDLNLGYIFQVVKPIDGTLNGETMLICECNTKE